MKSLAHLLVPLVVSLLSESLVHAAQKKDKQDRVVLSRNLELISLDSTSYVVSQTSDPYQANGLMVLNGNEVILVDAKNNPSDAELLLQWIKSKNSKASITVINSHFHADATGSNSAYKKNGARIIASDLTQQKLVARGETHATPTETFSLSKPPELKIGQEDVKIIFPGASHAPDDFVVYFPQRKLLFGSCMVKVGSDLGYLGDADLVSWKQAIKAVKKISAAKIIPGHGLDYSPAIVENTARLLDEALARKLLSSN